MMGEGRSKSYDSHLWLRLVGGGGVKGSERVYWRGTVL